MFCWEEGRKSVLVSSTSDIYSFRLLSGVYHQSWALHYTTVLTIEIRLTKIRLARHDYMIQQLDHGQIISSRL